MQPDYDKTCFAIMPIGPADSKIREQSDDTYERIIKSAVKKANVGLTCVRADDINRSGFIMDDIIEHTVKSRFVIADLSNRNSNVFYELGIRHSWTVRTILLAQKREDVPFDISWLRTIFYSKETGDKIEAAVAKLCEFLVEMDGSSPKNDSPVLRLFSREPVPLNRGEISSLTQNEQEEEFRSPNERVHLMHVRNHIFLSGYRHDTTRSFEGCMYWKRRSGRGEEHLFLLERCTGGPGSALYAEFLRVLEQLFGGYSKVKNKIADSFSIIVPSYVDHEAESTLNDLRGIWGRVTSSVSGDDKESPNALLLAKAPVEIWNEDVMNEMEAEVLDDLFGEQGF